ncbi:MAG TPA: hypothetical protein VL992_13585, partial [Tepidisphaeraceae bacterium]|nr:hypothetical protein [Tepidisphaeraceae bacterium]
RITQVPGNVILMMDGYKPNDIMYNGAWTNPSNGAISNNYQNYFGSDAGSSPTTAWNDVINSSSLNANYADRVGRPHEKRTMTNVLSADGHVVTINPYLDPTIYPQTQPGTGTAQPAPTPTGNPNSPYKYPSNAVFSEYLIGPGPGTYFPSTSLTGSVVKSVWNKYLPGL